MVVFIGVEVIGFFIGSFDVVILNGFLSAVRCGRFVLVVDVVVVCFEVGLLVVGGLIWKSGVVNVGDVFVLSFFFFGGF